MASKFVRVSTQFIAALDNPEAKTGAGACKLGIWREDPGPRGIHDGTDSGVSSLQEVNLQRLGKIGMLSLFLFHISHH